VADDVAASIGVWSDISEISGGFGPADGGGRVGFVGIDVNEVAGVAGTC
jgi:hypothetical protein